LPFEEYEREHFEPAPAIRELARTVNGKPDGFADLKHIRCDIYRRVVLVDPPLDEQWYQTHRCSAGTHPYARVRY
jgi:hypothetical protein